MSLEGPQLRYARVDDVQTEDTLEKALDLARQLEELLEDTRSIYPSTFPPASPPAPGTSGVEEARSHQTRMARAMAAGLVNELENLVRPARRTGAS
jgi:hypothetical protein